MCTTDSPITPAVPVAPGTEEARHPTIALEPVDSVTVTTLVDNVIDLLAVDAGPARRPFIGDATRGSSPLFEGGWMYMGLLAEPGFSVLVTVERAGAAHRILFDAGLSPDALVTNMRRLGLDPGDVEVIVLSHGHSDHTTGLDGFVRAVGRASVPVLIHPDFWNRRRLVIPGRDRSSCRPRAPRALRAPALRSSRNASPASCSITAC